MEINWLKISDEALRVVSSIIIGVVLAYFGLRIYFRQKEYEIVKQRYLEQGLDVVAGELESVASTFMHNWSRALELVKELRDSPENFEVTHIGQGFLPFKGSNFNASAHHRLRMLTGSDVFWRFYQLALSRHLALNAIATNEIPHAISEYVSGRLPNAEVSEIVEEAFKTLQPMPGKSDEFAFLLHALHRVTGELERSRLGFGKIQTFAKNECIKNVVKELEDHYRSRFLDKDVESVLSEKM